MCILSKTEKSYLRDVTQALSVEQSLEYGANLSQSRGSRTPEASQPARRMETS